MSPNPLQALVTLWLVLFLGACATRPVNPPIAKTEPDKGYRLVTRAPYLASKDSLVVLAFSGGGTRAAAFSYGALELLRDTEVVGPQGNRIRLLDHVDVITGVSGGSFTALAYGLYGGKLFEMYEQAFLKRNVQGELLARFLSPTNWGALWSESWGRSEMAAQLYDDILFHKATYADLERGSGPLVVASATDISSGARFGFVPTLFDMICSDLSTFPLSRAAAASSAVPFALSPVTINNYGGTCGYTLPPLLQKFADPKTAPRPAARAIRRMQEVKSYEDSKLRPFIHLVDGGLADNLGMRGVIEVLEEIEALHTLGVKTPLDNVKRIVVFVVNSLSVPRNDWDLRERPPGDVTLLIKATGVPIDHYSYDSVELIRDTIARWRTMRRIRALTQAEASRNPELAALLNVPDIDLYAIDVSFPRLADPAEVQYLNDLPTSFVLPPEAVDRLREAAGKIILESPDFQRLLKDVGARIVPRSRAAAAAP